MSGSPLDKVPAHNRVSIRAVLVHEGEDASAALAEAGFAETITVPVVLGEQPDLPGGILGNGITPNVTAVLETEQEEETGASVVGQTDMRRAERGNVGRSGPVTSMLPSAYGMQPLAPVRRTSSTERGPAPTTDHSDDRDMIDLPQPDRFAQMGFPGIADGTKFYANAQNDPVDRTDPLDNPQGGGGSTEAVIPETSQSQADRQFGTQAGLGVRDKYRPGAGFGDIQLAARSTPPPPLPEAGNQPHTTIQKPGPDGGYTTYDKYGPVLQYRGDPSGTSHGDLPRPNVKIWPRNTAPNGTVYPGTPTVRPPLPSEVPGVSGAPSVAPLIPDDVPLIEIP